MSLGFPSPAFDDAVAAVCHDLASDEQMRALNELLRSSPAARDEYLVRLELHSRLASAPDLFASTACATHVEELPPLTPGLFLQGEEEEGQSRNILPFPPLQKPMAWAVALAACFTLLAGGIALWLKRPATKETTSSAVAVLTHVVDAQWRQSGNARPVGAALEPGWLRLKAGLVQVGFYSGARCVIEGPAEFQLVGPREAFCRLGRAIAEVPPQARGFRVGTPQATVVDLGTAFGLDVKSTQAEVHVFQGRVDLLAKTAAKQGLKEGEATVVDNSGATRHIAADASLFGALFDFQKKSLALQELRQEQWRAASTRLNHDHSLLVRFDFEHRTVPDWSLRNAAVRGASVPDATIVGCQWTEGRWPGKHALEFRSVSDRVRLNVPGEFRTLTLTAWVNVKGLDREFNSLFMCDGFEAGEIHWQIRNDGVLDLGVQGPRPRDLQIYASPPVIGFNQFGQWVHLAVVVDGEGRQVIHYVNGTQLSQHTLKREPPFRIGEAELGNWNPGEIPNKPPFLIRHFSGAMDEFAAFSRALSDAEIHRLYSEGQPQPGTEQLSER